MRMSCLKYLFIFPLFMVISGFSIDAHQVDTTSIVDEKTLQEKWSLLESRFQGLVQNGVRLLISQGIEASTSLNISSTCIKETLKVISGLKRMKIWAFKFFDASSKSIDGILSLSRASLGNFDECINNEVIEERSSKHKLEVLFRGKYCTVLLKPYLPPKPKKIRLFQTLDALKNFTSKDTVVGELAKISHLAYSGLSVSVALCVPSGCSKDDINQVLEKASDYMGGIFNVERCQIKEDTHLTPAMIFVLCLYSTAGILLLAGTVTDFYYWKTQKTSQSIFIQILKSFSFIYNFRKFTDTSTSCGTLKCLHGIKVLSTAWIILTHGYIVSGLSVHKIPDGLTWPKGFVFQAIANGTLAVNTFFFLSGLLVCRSVTKSYKIENRKFNILIYVLHRFFRILPVYAFVIAFQFLLPLIGSGPNFYHATDFLYKPCLQNWWASLLFISNYYQSKSMCVMQGWYLSVDMQFYIGALIILLPLIRWPKFGFAIAVMITIASIIGSFFTLFIYDLPPTFLYTPDISEFYEVFTQYYIQPQTHAGSYAIGILCGYLLVMYPKLSIPKSIQVIGWIFSIIIIISVVHGVQKWNSGMDVTFWDLLFYGSFHRVAWTLAIAWIIVSCVTGHGGVVNYILSWTIWVPLGRLTLLAYLIGPVVQMVFFSTTRTEFLAEHRIYVWTFFGHLGVTYLFSFGGSMLVESPLLSLEKLLFSKAGNLESSNLKNQGNQTVVGNGLSLLSSDCMEIHKEKKVVLVNEGMNNIAAVLKL